MPYHKLFYHFIWATKRREALILPEFEANLHNIIVTKSVEMGGIVYALDGTKDHVHLATSLPPKIAPSTFIGEVKGHSSHFVNHTILPGFKFYWQSEFAVLSFAERNLPAIVRYIKNQKEHHAQNTLNDALEKIT